MLATLTLVQVATAILYAIGFGLLLIGLFYLCLFGMALTCYLFEEHPVPTWIGLGVLIIVCILIVTLS